MFFLQSIIRAFLMCVNAESLLCPEIPCIIRICSFKSMFLRRIRMKELLDLFFTFARIGGLTFGGGYAMLPMLQKEVVEKRG